MFQVVEKFYPEKFWQFQRFCRLLDKTKKSWQCLILDCSMTRQPLPLYVCVCVQAGTIGSTSTSRCDATSSSSCCRRTFPPRSWWCFHGCRSGSTAGPCRPESPWVKQKLKKHKPFEMSFEEIVPEENLSVWNDESWLWHGSTSGEHTHACVNTQTSHTPPLLLFFWFVFCIEAFAALVMQTSGFPHWALLISLIKFSWYDGMVLQNPLTGFYSSTTQCALGLFFSVHRIYGCSTTIFSHINLSLDSYRVQI